MTAARRVSPVLVTERADLAGRRFEDHVAGLDLDAADQAVEWATGDAPAPGLAGRGREYMERYVHQHQIREAAGRPRVSAELTGPVLTTAAHSLPVALAPVPRPEGAVVLFTAEGDGGRTWHLVMAAEGWDLRVGLPLGPAACAAATTVDGAIKLYASDPVAPPLTWHGDPQIAAALAKAKAVLG